MFGAIPRIQRSSILVLFKRPFLLGGPIVCRRRIRFIVCRTIPIRGFAIVGIRRVVRIIGIYWIIRILGILVIFALPILLTSPRRGDRVLYALSIIWRTLVGERRDGHERCCEHCCESNARKTRCKRFGGCGCGRKPLLWMSIVGKPHSSSNRDGVERENRGGSQWHNEQITPTREQDTENKDACRIGIPFLTQIPLLRKGRNQCRKPLNSRHYIPLRIAPSSPQPPSV